MMHTKTIHHAGHRGHAHTGDALEDSVGGRIDSGKAWAAGRVDAAIDGGERLYDGASETVNAATGRAAAMAHRVADNVRASAASASEQAADIRQHAVSDIARASKFAGTQLQERPLTTLLLAALAGGVLGHYLSDRR